MVLVHEIFPAASHRRMVRLHTPKIEAAIPILTQDVMMPYPVKYQPLNHHIIYTVSNFVQEKDNCSATPEFLSWFLQAFVYLIFGIAILGQVDEFRNTFWFDARPDSVVQVWEDAIEQRRVHGTTVVPFSREICVSAVKYLTRANHLVARSDGKKRGAVRFGPVDDAFGCYYATMEGLHAWLAKDGYFLGIEELQMVSIGKHPSMGEIARKIAGIETGIGIGIGIGDRGTEAAYNQQKHDAMDQVKAMIEHAEEIWHDIVPETLDAVSRSLVAPIERYIDVIGAGEKILLVYHSPYKNTRQEEVILTTEGAMIGRKDVVMKVRYVDMIGVKVTDVASDGISFKVTTIDLRAGLSVACIVLEGVPFKSLLFPILYKKAGITVES
jgi:hypothetical protein